MFMHENDKAGIIVGPDRQSESDRIASPSRIRSDQVGSCRYKSRTRLWSGSDRVGIKVGPDPYMTESLVRSCQIAKTKIHACHASYVKFEDADLRSETCRLLFSLDIRLICRFS